MTSRHVTHAPSRHVTPRDGTAQYGACYPTLPPHHPSTPPPHHPGTLRSSPRLSTEATRHTGEVQAVVVAKAVVRATKMAEVTQVLAVMLGTGHR